QDLSSKLTRGVFGGDDIPERGIAGLPIGGLVPEDGIGEGAAGGATPENREDTQDFFSPTGGQQTPRSNQGIAAPVQEPWVAGDHRASGVPAHHIICGGGSEAGAPLTPGRAVRARS